ncbi:MAG TPA: hypothetical protein VNS63_19980 [Blastocatellia bacterium]|nr:hypothetical protein [Blastocatellia bacterium]
MKRILGLTFILTVVAFSIAAARPRAFQGASVVGSWDVTIDSPQGQRTVVMVIKKDGEKLSGAMKSQAGERPLDSVALKGDEITFVMTRQVQGQDMVITYKGKVAKDSMKGDADFGGLATGTWTAVPHKEEAAATSGGAGPSPAAQSSGATNISGAWDVTVETSGGSGSPSFTFKQDGEKLTGNYKGQFGEAPLTGTVKGDDVKFTINISAQGQSMTVTYTGKITGKDSMKGTVSLGELGEGTWSGKRK